MTSTSSFTRQTLALLLLLLLGAGLVLAAASRAHAQDPTPDPTPAVVVEQGAPVVVNGETLFRVTDPGTFETATERAEAIATNIERVINNPFVSVGSVTLVESDAGTEVVLDEEVLFTITDADAAALGMTRAELGEAAADSLNASLAAAPESAPASTLAWVLALLIALVVLVAIIVVVNIVVRWLEQRLEPTTPGSWLPDWFTRTTFYQSGASKRALGALLNVLRLVAILLLFILILPWVLNLFPRTQEVGDIAFEPITSSLALIWDGFVGFLPQLVFMLMVFLIAWVVTWIIRSLFREVKRGTIRIPNFRPEWSDMSAALLSFFVWMIALIVVLSSLPIADSRALAGVLGFTGLIITLASGSAISNIISGIVLTYTNALTTGDVVQINQMDGTVVETGILTTRLRTFRNEIVTLPNSLVLSGAITNYSRLADANRLLLHTEVTIGYDVDRRTVTELLLAAAGEAEGVLKSPSPYVLQRALGDYSVTYELNAYTNTPEYMPILYSRLHEAILDQFNAAGIEILSPVYSAVRDGNKLTLPEEYLPEGYVKPSLVPKRDAPPQPPDAAE